MKKILLFLFLFLFSLLFELKVEANDTQFRGDIISIMGTGSNSILFQDGVNSVSGIVDWDNVGDYEVYCNTDDDLYKTNVYVRDSSSLESGIEIFKDVGTLNFNNNIKYEAISFDAYPLNKNVYFAYYNYLYNNKKYSFLLKFNEKLNEAYYSFDYCSSIESMCVNGNYLYVLMNVYNEFSSIQILKFDLNLKLISSFTYDSNSDDLAKEIFFIKSSLYIFIELSSNQGIIERENSNKVIAILRINPLNYVVEDYKIIYNNYDNYLYDVKIYDGLFFLLVNLNGSDGSFYHGLNRSYSGYFLISLSCDFKTKCLKCFEDEFISYESYDFDSNNFCVAWKENDYKLAVKCGQFSSDISFEIDSFSKKITSLCTISIGDNFYLFVNLDNKLSKIIIVNNGNYKIKDIKNKSFECIRAIINENGIYFYCEDYEARLYSFDLIECNYDLMYNDGIEYQSIKVFKNNISLKGNEIMCLDEAMFGEYLSESMFLSDEYIITYYSKYKVPLKINIRTNEMYDPDLYIEFNASGFLNGVAVDRCVTVNEIGKYQLEINAKNGESEIFEFEIIDLNVNVLDKNSFIESDDVFTYNGFEKEDTSNFKYNLIVNTDILESSVVNEQIIIFVFSLICLYLFLLLFLKKKIRLRGEKR